MFKGNPKKFQVGNLKKTLSEFTVPIVQPHLDEGLREKQDRQEDLCHVQNCHIVVPMHMFRFCGCVVSEVGIS